MNKTKRFLAMLLSILLITTSMPLAAFAGGDDTTTIDTIDITNVVVPVTEQKAAFDFDISDAEAYDSISSAWLITAAMPTAFADLDSADYVFEGDAFAANTYYTFVAYVTPKEGYEMAEGLTVTINGEPANVREKNGEYQIAATFQTGAAVENGVTEPVTEPEPEETTTGTLVINQMLTGDLTLESEERFTYYINNSSDGTMQTVSEKLSGSEDSFSVELEPGKYSIVPKLETINGYAPTAKPTSAIVTIKAGETEEVSFTRNYTLVDATNETVEPTTTVTLFINKTSYDMGGITKTSDSAPVIVSDRTFVPYRLIAEAFGAEVSWNATDRSVSSKLDDTTVIMWIGSQGIRINHASDGVADGVMDVAPYINSANRTMVPVRFVAEALGCTVTPIYATDGTTERVVFTK